MIIHAKVAKLYRYLNDDNFCRVMRLVEASMDEGLQSYEVEVDRLNEDIKFELIEALEEMGYDVTYHPDEELLKVSIPD